MCGIVVVVLTWCHALVRCLLVMPLRGYIHYTTLTTTHAYTHAHTHMSDLYHSPPGGAMVGCNKIWRVCGVCKQLFEWLPRNKMVVDETWSLMRGIVKTLSSKWIFKRTRERNEIMLDGLKSTLYECSHCNTTHSTDQRPICMNCVGRPYGIPTMR